MFSGHGSPRHEFADAGRRMTGGQFFERLRQPGVRIDAAELAVFDERGDHSTIAIAFVAADK